MVCIHDELANCSDCLPSDQKNLSRHDQRALVFHLLYAMDSFEYAISLETIAENLSRGFGYAIDTHSDIFKEAQSIIAQREKLDEEIKPLLDNWKFERLGVCTKLILRLALWEFVHTQIDHVVIIDEAIELSKCFAETDAYKFINGILDEWAKRKQFA